MALPSLDGTVDNVIPKQGTRFWEDSVMGYHLEGPLGRYTVCSASPRRDGEHAPSPLVDLIRVGVSALSRLPHTQHTGGSGRRHG